MSDSSKQRASHVRSQAGMKRKHDRKNEIRRKKKMTIKCQGENNVFKQNFNLLRQNKQLNVTVQRMKKASLHQLHTKNPTSIHQVNMHLHCRTMANQHLSDLPVQFPVDGMKRAKTSTQSIKRGGCFGQVYPVHLLKLSGRVIVAKEIAMDKATPLDINLELKVSHALSGHKNFPYVYGYIEPNILLMENLGKYNNNCLTVDTIHDILISSQINFDEDWWVKIAGQLIEGLVHMHGLFLLHNDIKTNNIIIKNEIATIIDFGKCTNLYYPYKYNLTNRQQHTYLKRYKHIAPELIDGSAFQSEKTDTYSLGHVFSNW